MQEGNDIKTFSYLQLRQCWGNAFDAFLAREVDVGEDHIPNLYNALDHDPDHQAEVSYEVKKIMEVGASLGQRSQN